MKRTFFVLVALFALIGVSNAQSSTTQQNKDNVQAQSRVFQVDHLLFITGKVYRSVQGQLTAIEQPVRLENGVVVNPNGSYQLSNQKHRHLAEGECLDMAGNRYENLVAFDNNKVTRMSQRDLTILKEATKASVEGDSKAADKL